MLGAHQQGYSKARFVMIRGLNQALEQAQGERCHWALVPDAEAEADVLLPAVAHAEDAVYAVRAGHTVHVSLAVLLPAVEHAEQIVPLQQLLLGFEALTQAWSEHSPEQSLR